MQVSLCIQQWFVSHNWLGMQFTRLYRVPFSLNVATLCTVNISLNIWASSCS